MNAHRSRYDSEKIEVRGRIKHETPATEKHDGALLMDVEFVAAGMAHRQEMWFPKSFVYSIHREYATKGHDRIFVAAWLAKERGLL